VPRAEEAKACIRKILNIYIEKKKEEEENEE
jgi:hypothetical protein